SVGPVEPTPTKPGRPGTGLGYLSYAAGRASIPWFVTGGVTPKTVPDMVAAGASRFVVVRWLTEASDPKAAAHARRPTIEPRATTGAAARRAATRRAPTRAAAWTARGITASTAARRATDGAAGGTLRRRASRRARQAAEVGAIRRCRRHRCSRHRPRARPERKEGVGR